MFEFHKLNDIGIERAKRIQSAFEQVVADLEEVVPAGRELSIVKTKLEEACFFAKRGMAIQKENQSGE